MLRVARVCDRVIWNHGGASSRLAKPAFPQVINVLSPASTYFAGVLQAILASDPTVTTVSLVHSTAGFGKDVAAGATTAASRLQFALHSVAFEPSQASSCLSLVPDADILLVVGNFADEWAIASPLLARSWRFAAFVGAGVEEVLAPLGQQREGLLGPAQWVLNARIVPDEGPDAEWFLTQYRQETGAILLMQRCKHLQRDCCMRVVCVRYKTRVMLQSWRRPNNSLVPRSLEGSSLIRPVACK